MYLECNPNLILEEHQRRVRRAEKEGYHRHQLRLELNR